MPAKMNTLETSIRHSNRLGRVDTCRNTAPPSRDDVVSGAVGLCRLTRAGVILRTCVCASRNHAGAIRPPADIDSLAARDRGRRKSQASASGHRRNLHHQTLLLCRHLLPLGRHRHRRNAQVH